MESDPIVISYAKNGEDLGTCFNVEKEKLGDQALFPHIMTKNTEFECNFGARVSLEVDDVMNFHVTSIHLLLL